MTLIRNSLVAVVIAACASQSVLAQEGEEMLRLEPSTAWVVDFAEDKCALRRAFGEGDEKVVLEISQRHHALYSQLFIYGKRLEVKGEGSEFVIGPGSDWQEVSRPLFGEVMDGGVGVQFSATLLASGSSTPTFSEYWMNDNFRAREAEIRELGLRGFFETDLVLEIGPLKDAMEVMRTCTDDLMAIWGLDPDTVGDVARPATPIDHESWSRTIVRNYPSEALRNGYEGTVNVMVVVGADGQVERCFVTTSNAHQTLRESACVDLERYGRFDPAVDDEGQQTRGLWFTTITYDI